jgi:capsular exopolysaccharide synthesis family protein
MNTMNKMLLTAPPETRRERCDPHLVSLKDPASFEAEQYRRLRQRLEDLRAARDARLFAVTSPVAGDGKSLTAVNLAASLAQAAKSRVLLIDADLRRPTIAGLLGLKGDRMPDFGSALDADGGSLSDLVNPASPSGLMVLPSRACRGAYERLRSPRLPELLQEARRHYDFVILDTPPIVPVPDSALLGKFVDGYLMVVAANRTPRKLLGEALNLLEPASVVGLIFNRDDRPLFGYYRSRYRDYFQSYLHSVDRATA